MSTLKELLNVYWLRPETALWRAIDIEVMKNFDICGNSLDLGCGDGVWVFGFGVYKRVDRVSHRLVGEH